MSNLDKRLKQVFDVILEETKINSEFAYKIERLLSGEVSTNKVIKRKRQSACINPLDLIENGEEQLKDELRKLDIEQLRDIVCEYRMDPSKLVVKWKNKDKVINHIVEMVKNREKKGDAFRL